MNASSNQRRQRKSWIRLSAGVLAGLGASVTAHAATYDWTNTLGNSSWNQGSNWSGGFVPAITDAAVFPTPGPASKTVNLPNSPTMNALSLAFNESYTLNSGQLTLGGTNSSISVAAGKTATINSVLGSSVGVTLSGGGTLVLNGNNQTSLAASGDMRINAGNTLRVSTDANLGQLFKTWTNGTLEADGTFSTTRRFEPGNGTIRVTSGNTLTLAANDQLGFSSTDTWTKEGDGTLKVTGSSSRFGATIINAGMLRLDGTVGYGQIRIGSAGTLESPGISGFISPVVSVTSGSIFRGVGTVTANNVIGASGGDITPTFVAGPNVADVFTIQMPTFGGTIGSTMTILGPGTVKLTQNTNYPGAWNVSSGKLRVASSGALGMVSPTNPAVSVASGATLILDGVTTDRTINLASGSALQGTGGLAPFALGKINVAPTASTSLGTLLSADIFTIGNGLTGGSSATLMVNGAGTVLLQAPSANYGGDWWVAFGTLRLSNAAALGTGNAPIRISHTQGTLLGTNGVTIARDINWENGTLSGSNGGAIYTGTITLGNAANATLNGTVTIGDGPNDLTGGGGGAVIHVAGFATATLAQSSNVVADWMIDNSTLSVSDDSQLGALANTITLNGVSARLTTTAGITSTRGLVFNAGQFNSGSFDSTFANVTGGTGSTLKLGDGTLTINRIRTNGTLTLSAGVLKINPDSTNSATSVLKAINVNAPGRLDLTNNKLIVHATPVGTWDGSAYTNVSGMIANGRAGGSGIGTSIVDGRGAIGVGNPATSLSTWGGQSVVPGDTLVMYTYGGDATLDGQINIDDYTRIDLGVASALAGWSNGDFNYDGKVNIDDYTIIDANIVTQGPPIETAGAGGSAGGISAVPEPGGSVVLMGGLIGLGLPIRRRKLASLRHVSPT